MRPTITIKNNEELRGWIEDEMRLHGNACDLNHLDVSQVTSFDGAFKNLPFTGDISSWNVKNAVSMDSMFENCAFNGDISQWNVAGVDTMTNMFRGSQFSGDLSTWDVSNLQVLDGMFAYSQFNGDVSTWKLTLPNTLDRVFAFSAFQGDISNWDVSSVHSMVGVFEGSRFNGDVSAWRPRRLAHAKNMFNTPFFHGDLSGWNLLPSGHYTGLVHPTFSGQLPPLPPTDPFAVYGAMLGSPHALDDYAARTDFCHVHADLLLANPTRCPWACPDTVRWAQEHASLGSAMGLEHGQLRATMVRNRADRGQGIGALPLLDAENFLP